MLLVFVEILRKHLGESPGKKKQEEEKKRTDFHVVYGNVKEKTLWFVSGARCHFLQAGAAPAASWYSQESGFQLGPAVQSMCLARLAQGHPCSEEGSPSLASSVATAGQPDCLCPQPVPAAGIAGCARLCRRYGSYQHPSPLHQGLRRGLLFSTQRCQKAKKVTSKARNVTLQSQQADCRAWVWLGAAMSRPVNDLQRFFSLQHLFGLSHQRCLLISMLIVGCLLLLKCAKVHSSGKSTLIKLQHL